jgi:hypothetical protein
MRTLHSLLVASPKKHTAKTLHWLLVSLLRHLPWALPDENLVTSQLYSHAAVLYAALYAECDPENVPFLEG